MSEKKEDFLSQKQDYLVCTCMGVMYSEIVQAIEDGCGDFQSLSDTLLVGTACTSCVAEVYDILAEVVHKK